MPKFLLLLAVHIALGVAPVMAETQRFGSFYVSPEEPTLIVMIGELGQNAPLDFRRALRAFPEASMIGLHSPGGDVTAALLIAQEVHERKMATFISADSECYSACAFVFLAGQDREVEGMLGVHQITNDSADLYSAQVAISDILETLADFDVPASVISDMLRTPPESMRTYDTAEAEIVGLNRSKDVAAISEQTISAPVVTSTAPSERTGFTTADKGPRDRAPLGASLVPPLPAQALLYSNDDFNGATTYYGDVWWSEGVDAYGQLTIVAEANVPAGPLAIKLIWSKADIDLASIVVDTKFEVRNQAQGGAVASLHGFLVKNEIAVVGKALSGAAVENYKNAFTFALSSDDQSGNNVELLSRNHWIDIAFSYASGRRAVISLQKDENAAAMFKLALQRWGLAGP